MLHRLRVTSPYSTIAFGVLLATLSRAATHDSVGSAYYVDCAKGNDAAGGFSPGTAWKSTGRVSRYIFQAGDSINFRRGSTCSGMLWPKGSGSARAAIRVDAWGTGSLPKIQAGPGQPAAFRLSDQEYWTIEHLEFSGGDPHGVFINGARGVLHGIHIRDVIVHDVTGEPASKEGGLLVVAPGSGQQRFDDVVIDGVTAYRTSQWAGILVGGVAFGQLPETARTTNVIVRNSIVHDVAGDGIVLFQVNRGLVENSIAWHTGMQKRETIGTPNGIWTWMCRDCAVRNCEAFLTHSPGIDGGAFDIDYGDENNIVEESYGHDTQGYCVAVYGAGQLTTNSVVRNNVCSGNGRSSKLALRQGAIFLSTWDGGKLKGVRVTGNRIFWRPPIAAPALINIAGFEGLGAFDGNAIQSGSRFLVESNASLLFDRNSYRYTGPGSPIWQYGGTSYAGFQRYQHGSQQDAHGQYARRDSRPALAASTQTDVRALSFRDASGKPVSIAKHPGEWLLLAFVSAASSDRDSRGQATIAASAGRQFRSSKLDTILISASPADADRERNLPYDWNTGTIRVLFDDGSAARALNVPRMPAIVLLSPEEKIVWRHDGLSPPGELGLTLRSMLGNPDYTQLVPDP